MSKNALCWFIAYAAAILTGKGDSPIFADHGCAAVPAKIGTVPAPRAAVEVEEDVYTFSSPAGASAGVMWCYGNTCINRLGQQVFATGIEPVPGSLPGNSIRWHLYQRTARGWQIVATSKTQTREPCPLASFPTGTLFVSDNPTAPPPDWRGSLPARPEILEFAAANPQTPQATLIPKWDGKTDFTDHSYRSFAADGHNGELFLIHHFNFGHGLAQWSFRDRQGNWSAQGKLDWPWGAEYPKPEPIRVAYPAVAIKDRAVYFFGVSDIIEPYPEWKEYKDKIKEFAFDFRRLFFTWSDDITKGKFHNWLEIANRDKTAGSTWPCDLWVAPDKAVHLVWTQHALDERFREKYFPTAKQEESLMHTILRDGKVVSQKAIEVGDGKQFGGVARWRGARFHVTEAGRLYVFYYMGGKDSTGKTVNENRLREIYLDGSMSEPVVVPLKQPFTHFFTATWRAGNAPSDVLDIYGVATSNSRDKTRSILRYARIRIDSQRL